MFIYNFKVNGSILFKAFFVLLLIICLALFSLSIYNIFKNIYNEKESIKEETVDDYIKTAEVSEISSKNYTNVLKQVHDNLDKYLGRKISFTGYIYKVDALKENEFVLARNMIINEASQTVVVGFLCKYDNINDFKELTWVNITGTIEKGYLDGDIPEIKIEKIEKVKKPDDEFVYPPDDTYVPTSVLY